MLHLPEGSLKTRCASPGKGGASTPANTRSPLLQLQPRLHRSHEATRGRETKALLTGILRPLTDVRTSQVRHRYATGTSQVHHRLEQSAKRDDSDATGAYEEPEALVKVWPSCLYLKESPGMFDWTGLNRSLGAVNPSSDVLTPSHREADQPVCRRNVSRAESV